MNKKVLILLPLIASLAACGSGSSSLTGATSTGTVSLLVTDDLTLSYSEVWVNIQSITATDANGQAVTLFQNSSGQSYNLSQLANVGALVDTQAVTPGTYTSFQITLDNGIKLVQPDGTVINATFDQTGNATFTMSVPGNLVVDASQNSTLALDFNLKNFTYDANTNTVTPEVLQTDPSTLNQTVATLPGQVQSVLSATQFILTPASGGSNITVTLHSSATVINVGNGTATVTTDTTVLQPGMNVRVNGSYDAANLAITASSVLINEHAATIRDELEGVVVSYDGATLTVDVKEASFIPGSNVINITNFDTAKYSRGSRSLLSAGQKVEIKGALDVNGNFSAAIIEIEGGIRNTSDAEGQSNYADDYAELKGQISATAAGTLTLVVAESEHVNGISNGSSVTISTASSWIKEGDGSCLVTGAQIEVKGAMNQDGTMAASMIEIQSGCGNSAGSDESSGGNEGSDSFADGNGGESAESAG